MPRLRRREAWANQNEPPLIDKREQVLDPMTAYQITSMMEGVVQRGTGTCVQSSAGRRRQDRHHQRREGRLVRRLHARPGGRRLCRLRQAAQDRQRRRPAADWRRRSCQRLLRVALADQPGGPFRVPAGIKLIRINTRTGMRAGPGDDKVILEAFKPGTAPGDSIFGDRRLPMPKAGRVGATPSQQPQQAPPPRPQRPSSIFPSSVRRPRALLAAARGVLTLRPSIHLACRLVTRM